MVPGAPPRRSPRRDRSAFPALALLAAAAFLPPGCAAPTVLARPQPTAGTSSPAVPPPVPPVRTAARTASASDAFDVGRTLQGSGLAFDVLEAGHRWRIVFAGRKLPRVVLYVVHGREFTVVLGKLFTVRPDVGVDFYRLVAKKNYDFDQLKLSVDEDGGVYASFEVPTRILDGQELLENVYGLAGAIDQVLPELALEAGMPPPALAPTDPDDDSLPLPPPRPPPSPAAPGLIEALRTAARPLVAEAR